MWGTDIWVSRAGVSCMTVDVNAVFMYVHVIGNS